MITNLTYKKLRKTGEMSLTKLHQTTETIARRYKVSIDPDEVVEKLTTEKNCNLVKGKLKVPMFKEKQDLEAKGEKVKSFNPRINKEDAVYLAEKSRKRKKLGLFGESEELVNIEMNYKPVYKINYEKRMEEGFKPLTLFVGEDYEVYYYDGDLKNTQSLEELLELNRNKIKVLKELRNAYDIEELKEKVGITPSTLKKYINDFKERNMIRETGDGRYQRIVDFPENLEEPKYTGIENRFTFKTIKGNYESKVDEKKLAQLPSLYMECEFNSVEPILLPVWKATYEKDGKKRTHEINAV